MTTSRNTQDIVLSGSTNGRGIAVAATATPGTTIHTVQSGTTLRDHITLWATNTDTGALDLTIEFGGTTAADKIVASLAAKETRKVVDNLPLQGALSVAAFAGSASKINIFGTVIRFTD